MIFTHLQKIFLSIPNEQQEFQECAQSHQSRYLDIVQTLINNIVLQQSCSSTF